MPIQPIKRVNVNDQVFEQMKELLIGGEWKPGDKLPSEHELSAMFGVSRVTVRNSLQKLAILDLIETRRGEGSFVRQKDDGNCINGLISTAYLTDDIREIQKFRLMVEPGAAFVAAGRATESDIRDLRHRVEVMLNLKNDLYALAKEDFAFHNQIGLITANPLMIRTYSIVEEALHSAMEKTVAYMGPDGGCYYHGKIVDAIAAHDAQTARDIMQSHIQSNLEPH